MLSLVKSSGGGPLSELDIQSPSSMSFNITNSHCIHSARVSQTSAGLGMGGKVRRYSFFIYLLGGFHVFQICGNLAAEVPESSNLLDKQLLITSTVSIRYDLPDNSTYSLFGTSIALGQPFIWT